MNCGIELCISIVLLCVPMCLYLTSISGLEVWVRTGGSSSGIKLWDHIVESSLGTKLLGQIEGSSCEIQLCDLAFKRN